MTRASLQGLVEKLRTLPKFVWRNGRAATPQMAEIGGVYETHAWEEKYAYVEWLALFNSVLLC